MYQIYAFPLSADQRNLKGTFYSCNNVLICSDAIMVISVTHFCEFATICRAHEIHRNGITVWTIFNILRFCFQLNFDNKYIICNLNYALQGDQLQDI